MAAALMLVVIVELTIDRKPTLRAPNETLMLLESIDRFIAAPEHADVLFLGDSSLRSSLDPKLFQSITGSTALNLGFVSHGGIYTDLVFLDRWLDRHAPPQSVVLVHGPHSFGTDADSDIYSLVATPSATLDLFLQRELGLVATADALLHELPSYRYKPYLRQTADRLLAGNFDQLDTNRTMWSEFLAERAALGYFPDPSPKEPPLASRSSFVLSARNRHALEKLIERTRETGSTLYFFAGPLHGEKPNTADQDRALRAFSDLVVLETDPMSSTDQEVGLQSDHLNRHGAARFTRAAADALRSRARH